MDAASSRGRPPYIIRRGDTFHLRVRVPRDLSGRIGISEVRRSFGVGRLSEARWLGPVYAARVKEAFKMIRVENLTRDQANRVIRDCFKDLAREVDGIYVPRSSEPNFDIAEQEHHSDEALHTAHHSRGICIKLREDGVERVGGREEV